MTSFSKYNVHVWSYLCVILHLPPPPTHTHTHTHFPLSPPCFLSLLNFSLPSLTSPFSSSFPLSSPSHLSLPFSPFPSLPSLLSLPFSPYSSLLFPSSFPSLSLSLLLLIFLLSPVSLTRRTSAITKERHTHTNGASNSKK